MDAWEYEMSRKMDREERMERRRSPGSLFGWDPRDPPKPVRDTHLQKRTVVSQVGKVKSIE